MSAKNQTQHVHHISCHFTNGLFPVASACITLFLLTGNTLFENATLCCCTIGAISAPIVFCSGLLDWRFRFKKRQARIFTRKRYVGVTLILVSILLITLRLSIGTELARIGVVKYIYAGITYILTGMVTYLGYLGGKFIV
jgi:uncharacterized membrane protein